MRIGVDFLVLGAVLPTDSRPTAQPMGWDGFRHQVAKAQIPAFALGGLGSDDGTIARRAGAQGVVLISRAWNAVDPATIVRHCITASAEV